MRFLLKYTRGSWIMCNTCCNTCNAYNTANACGGGLFNTLFGNSCQCCNCGNNCGCNAARVARNAAANACRCAAVAAQAAAQANSGCCGCGCGCGCGCQKKGRRTYHGQNLSRTALRRVRRSGGRSDDRNGRRMHDVQYGGYGCQCKRRRIRFLLCSSVWIVSLQCDQYLRLRQLTLSEKGGGSLRIRLRFLWLIISLKGIGATLLTVFDSFRHCKAFHSAFLIS